MPGAPVNVICMKWGKRYPARYVNILFRSIGTGMPGDVFASNAYPSGSTARYGFVRIGEMGHGSHGE